MIATTPVTTLKGVGVKLSARLAKLGIETINDLLFHIPLHYQDRTHITSLLDLHAGQEALIEAVIVRSELSRGRRVSLNCLLQDDSGGELALRFIHFHASQKHQLSAGQTVRCYGEVRQGLQGLEMIHPEYQILDERKPLPVAKHLTPIYPSTEGLHQRTLRNLIEQVLPELERMLPDLIPSQIKQRFKLINLQHAVRQLHQSDSANVDGNAWVRRIAFDELLAHQLSLQHLRSQRQQDQAMPLNSNSNVQRQFELQLPFSLTQAQQRVIKEIALDLAKTHPMQRLVQGDVGSGKTVVAIYAALAAIAANKQVAVMAPTELLSEQHYKNFSDYLTPLGVNVAWLTGRHKGKTRQKVLVAISSGDTRVIVGTHALFQEQVEFHDLALVIIDEQHRFGVSQRLTLRSKGEQHGLSPHQLVMTATPIPRTLAMSVYADLDTSVIDELPAGRKPVITAVSSDRRRAQLIERIRLSCSEGRQAYWVCTLIEESETLQCQAAEDTAEELQRVLSELQIGLVHGRLKSEQKAQVMTAFKTGEIDLLVATTVIEVGVDVTNASLMIIENPERLGLAQLHQLRGRIGRGTTASHCVLLYKPPLSEQARERLAVLRDTHDGFIVAQRDLELRGPGEILGAKQTGVVQFKVADLLRDADLLPKVQAVAAEMLDAYPEQTTALIQRWLAQEKTEHYGAI